MRGFIEVAVSIDETGTAQRELLNTDHIVKVKEFPRNKLGVIRLDDGERCQDLHTVQKYDELVGLISRARQSAADDVLPHLIALAEKAL